MILNKIQLTKDGVQNRSKKEGVQNRTIRKNMGEKVQLSLFFICGKANPSIVYSYAHQQNKFFAGSRFNTPSFIVISKNCAFLTINHRLI